jgi:RNA polymerase sigma-70 factor (ECF subfamily)
MSEFNGLVEREIPRLRRYARALTRSADRADDLVQETLLRAISKSMVRRAMRDEATIDIEQVSSSLVAITDPTASSQLRELEQSLGRLPGEQREVILLVGLEGMSYETAAKVLSVPVGTVRSRLSRGRDALRRLMGLPEKAARAVEAPSEAAALAA